MAATAANFTHDNLIQQGRLTASLWRDASEQLLRRSRKLLETMCSSLLLRQSSGGLPTRFAPTPDASQFFTQPHDPMIDFSNVTDATKCPLPSPYTFNKKRKGQAPYFASHTRLDYLLSDDHTTQEIVTARQLRLLALISLEGNPKRHLFPDPSPRKSVSYNQVYHSRVAPARNSCDALQ